MMEEKKEEIACLLSWYDFQRHANNINTGYNKSAYYNYNKHIELTNKFIEKLNNI